MRAATSLSLSLEGAVGSLASGELTIKRILAASAFDNPRHPKMNNNDASDSRSIVRSGDVFIVCFSCWFLSVSLEIAASSRWLILAGEDQNGQCQTRPGCRDFHGIGSKICVV